MGVFLLLKPYFCSLISPSCVSHFTSACNFASYGYW